MYTIFSLTLLSLFSLLNTTYNPLYFTSILFCIIYLLFLFFLHVSLLHVSLLSSCSFLLPHLYTSLCFSPTNPPPPNYYNYIGCVFLTTFDSIVLYSLSDKVHTTRATESVPATFHHYSRYPILFPTHFFVLNIHNNEDSLFISSIHLSSNQTIFYILHSTCHCILLFYIFMSYILDIIYIGFLSSLLITHSLVYTCDFLYSLHYISYIFSSNILHIYLFYCLYIHCNLSMDNVYNNFFIPCFFLLYRYSKHSLFPIFFPLLLYFLTIVL